jgi:hypothetical protein
MIFLLTYYSYIGSNSCMYDFSYLSPRTVHRFFAFRDSGFEHVKSSIPHPTSGINDHSSPHHLFVTLFFKYPMKKCNLTSASEIHHLKARELSYTPQNWLGQRVLSYQGSTLTLFLFLVSTIISVHFILPSQTRITELSHGGRREESRFCFGKIL